MEAKHTPGKLERNSIKGWELWIGADYHIADVHGNIDSRRANALHIVNCWNSHDALLKACKAFQNRWKRSGPLGSAQWEKFDKVVRDIDIAVEQAEKGIQ